VLAIASCSLVIAAAVAVQSAAAPLQVGIVFVGGRVSPAASSAIEEAARIWAPYGVSVRRAGTVAANYVLVRVRIADTPPPGMGDPRALGSIAFHDGAPDPDIALYESRLWEFICETPDSRAAQWPASYRELIVGRALGRALAHELGHFLLRMRGHSLTGLMRPAQSIADLTAEDRGPWFLTAPDRAALAAATRRFRCPDPR
jgi:hypothetical protein